MADEKPLPKVYYPRSNGTVKVLQPSHQRELEGLLRIGWKIVEDGK